MPPQIPKPAGRQNLHDVMLALKLKPRTFETWKKDVSELVEKYLVLDAPVKRQSPDSLLMVINEACLVYPKLGRYEDHWPLRCYIAYYLSRRCSQSQRFVKSKNEGNVGSRATSPEIPLLLSPGLRYVRFREPKEEEVDEDDLRSVTYSPPPNIPSESRRVSGSTQSHRVVGSHINADPGLVYEGGASDSIEDFLRALNPKLVDIAENLRSTGACKGTDLVEVFQWPESAREHFLQMKAGLTPFQLTMLKVAFERSNHTK